MTYCRRAEHVTRGTENRVTVGGHCRFTTALMGSGPWQAGSSCSALQRAAAATGVGTAGQGPLTLACRKRTGTRQVRKALGDLEVAFAGVNVQGLLHGQTGRGVGGRRRELLAAVVSEFDCPLDRGSARIAHSSVRDCCSNWYRGDDYHSRGDDDHVLSRC